MTLLTGLVIAGSPASATTPAVEPAAGDTDVEQELLDELAAEDAATFWVYLDEQADLSAASGIADRSDQGWFVYDELTETAETSQADLVAILDAEGVDYQSFWIANTIKVTGNAELLDRIAALPEVAQITADRTYRLPEPIPSREEPRVQAVEWGIDRINAPQVWSTFGVTGQDIVIGSIDTGVQFDHPALVAQYRGNLGGGQFDHNYNWWDPSNICGNPSLVPCDNNGHGTHTVGTMVGDDGGNNQIGVAPGARWVAAKGCETSGCSQNALLESGQFMLAPTDLQGDNPNPELRPHIVNNSWGGSATTDPWYRPTVQAWEAAGIFPQFANGNTTFGTAPCGSSSNPGNLPESYAAGAFDINNNIAAFSNRGPSAWDSELIKPNLSAPGVNVRSSLPGNEYGSGSGTSMASPHVAGTVALMWSAAVALERNITDTRALLDQTAIDTEDLTCGGTPENNNVWGQGRLDAFAAVDQSPRGPTGELAGKVTDAGDPISGATITITGEANRQRITGEDGTYAVTLPVGGYTVSASAFGYADQTATVTVTEGQTTTQNFPMVAVPTATVSGTITDGSGHGWPMWAEVGVSGTPVSVTTDPRTGQYSLQLPLNASYELVARSNYPGYEDATATVDVAESDVIVDLTMLVDLCQAPGYEFSANIGILGDQVGSEVTLLKDFLAEQGIPSTPVVWGDDVSSFDTIVVNRPSDPGKAVFEKLLADADEAGVGLVFLDTWQTNGGNGIELLNKHLGNPATRESGFSQTPFPFYLYYEVTAPHPVLDGFEVGDEVVLDEASLFKHHAWFGGYEGEGREVIARASRSDTGPVGDGIGVQQRATNRHVLLSMSAAGIFNGPQVWHPDGAQVFLNALEWTSEATFECLTVDGGLVVGQVQDRNTGEGVPGATVTSVGNPAQSGTSTDDGSYFLFSSLTGDQQFTASANDYVDDTQTVSLVADDATGADFSLAAGQLTIDPTEVEATVRLGQSADRTFTVTNTGTAPAEVELVESGGGFEILGGDASSTTGPRQPTGDSGAGITTAKPDGETREIGDDLTWSTSGLEPGLRGTPTLPGTTQDELTITHSASQDVVSANSGACGPGGGVTTENGYLRHFVLDDFDITGDFEVSNVSFGIEAVIGPPHPVTVNLYTVIDPDGDFDYPNFNPIGSANVELPAQSMTIVDVPVTGTAPAGSTLVAEVETPNMVGQGGGLFIGSNPDGQTAPSYLRSASCGVVVPTDTAELGFPGMHVVMNVTGEAGGDQPWLEIEPTTATLQPGDSFTVTASMDSSATEEQQPGAYTAGVRIRHDTPYSVPAAGVTMNVAAPNNWGKITGTVAGVDCNGQDAGVLADATVQVNGKRDQVELSTGGDGGYAYWLPVNNNPLQLVVGAGGYETQTRSTIVIPRQTVTEDFTLQATCTAAVEGEVTPL